MKFSELLFVVLLIIPIFAIVYMIGKCNLYLNYGFISLKKILIKDDVKSCFKLIVKYCLFWTMILLLIMYLIAIYVICNTSWWQI